MNETNVVEAIDYRQKQLSSTSYRFFNVNPETSQPTLVAGSIISTDFLLPNRIFNLWHSYLNYDYRLAAGGAATIHTFAHSGFLAPIDSIVLSSNDNARLCEFTNLPQWTKLTWRAMTDYQRFLTIPCHTNAIDSQTLTFISESGQLFNKTRALPSVANAAGVRDSQGGVLHLGGAATAIAAQLALSDGAYDPVSNYISSDAANKAVCVRVRLPLHMLYGSIFAVDKDIYAGQQLRMTVRWNAADKWGFRITSDGAAIPDATAVTADASAVVANVVLQLALESNEGVKAEVMNLFRSSGINMAIPYTHTYKTVLTIGNGTTNNIIRKLNRNHGSQCLRIIAGVFPVAGNDTGMAYCSLYNHSTALTTAIYAAPRWAAYRTYLDGTALQDQLLLMSDFSAYVYNQQKFRESCVKNAKDWAQNCVIIEDFSGVPRTIDYVKTDHVASGLDLSTEREFVIDISNAAADPGAQQFFLFAVCQKMVSFSPSGVIVS